MKRFKKLAAILLTAAIMFGAMPPVSVHAEEQDLTITTNINKAMEIPLTLDASTDEFYLNANINPGDVMSADVIFKNVSDSDIQVRISDVTDQLETTMSKKLLEILNLTISVDGSTIYKGTHDKVTNPLTQWITLGPNENLTMKISVEFPKYEADNTFQGAEMRVKYVFEARADVPLDDTTSNRNSETVKTGVDDTSATNPMAVVLIVVAVVVIGGFVVFQIVSKKKKDKENE